MVLKKLGSELFPQYLAAVRYLLEEQGVTVIVEPSEYGLLVMPPGSFMQHHVSTLTPMSIMQSAWTRGVKPLVLAIRYYLQRGAPSGPSLCVYGMEHGQPSLQRGAFSPPLCPTPTSQSRTQGTR